MSGKIKIVLEPNNPKLGLSTSLSPLPKNLDAFTYLTKSLNLATLVPTLLNRSSSYEDKRHGTSKPRKFIVPLPRYHPSGYCFAIALQSLCCLCYRFGIASLSLSLRYRFAIFLLSLSYCLVIARLSLGYRSAIADHDADYAFFGGGAATGCCHREVKGKLLVPHPARL